MRLHELKSMSTKSEADTLTGHSTHLRTLTKHCAQFWDHILKELLKKKKKKPKTALRERQMSLLEATYSIYNVKVRKRLETHRSFLKKGQFNNLNNPAMYGVPQAQ